ncbi:sigma-70 family RNA polymerase sigma factor [Actinoplanes sp. NPDC089786]|uniref:sigma-70 family RNA polymerase sigma factor n=1 Tax=Actinoplanes sp. NPDC089786 TaxID=3155185 RepID=UPI003431F4F4
MTCIDQLHATHANSVLRHLLRLTNGDRPTAEDMLQETMLRAWRNVEKLPAHEEEQRRWLLTVARRIVIDSARARNVRPAELPIFDLDRITRVEDTTDAALAGAAIVAAWRRLSAAHREVLTLLHLRGRSVDEVAEELSLPIGTVRSRSHYALRALREGMAVVD